MEPVTRRHLLSRYVASGIGVVAALACREVAKEAAKPGAASSPPDTGAVTPDSLLPAPSFAGVPGWMVLGMRKPFRGRNLNGSPTDSRTITVDSGLAIFPPNDAWRTVGRATPLRFIGLAGDTATVYPDGAADWLGDADATAVRIRPAGSKVGTGWLVPASMAGNVSLIPIHDSVSSDGNTRIWSAGEYRIRLQRTGKLSADIFAEHADMSVKRARGPQIDSAADAEMGVDSDSLLDIAGEAHIPVFHAGYRFGPRGPVVILFSEAGYECNNFRVIVFRESRVDWIEEPHFTGDCVH